MTAPFVVTRSFDAPRERVWAAWTEPAHLKRWMSPAGFAVIAANMDFRPGGSYHYGLRGPDGREMWGKWEFREIAAPARLVFIQSFSDAAGGLTRHPMAPTWPRRTLSTIALAEQGAATLLTLEWMPFEAAPEEIATFDAGRPGMTQGWNGTMDQLVLHLKGN